MLPCLLSIILISQIYFLPVFNPSRPDFGRGEKINLNFYFHTSLWCFKRFYEGFKDALLGLRKFVATKSLLKMMEMLFILP